MVFKGRATEVALGAVLIVVALVPRGALQSSNSSDTEVAASWQWQANCILPSSSR